MLTIKENATMFVKGFAQEVNYNELKEPEECEGEFIAVITDLKTSGYVKVISANMNKDGKWLLECSNGDIYTLDKEPAVARELNFGKLITNFVAGITGTRYDEVFPDQYDDAIRAINRGDQSFQISGYISRRRKVLTSSVVRFWTDPEGKKHGVTKSGSHYIF